MTPTGSIDLTWSLPTRPLVDGNLERFVDAHTFKFTPVNSTRLMRAPTEAKQDPNT